MKVFFFSTEDEIKAFSARERFSHFFGRKKRVHVSHKTTSLGKLRLSNPGLRSRDTRGKGPFLGPCKTKLYPEAKKRGDIVHVCRTCRARTSSLAVDGAGSTPSLHHI